MTVLVLAEHDNTAIKSATLNATHADFLLDKQDEWCSWRAI